MKHYPLIGAKSTILSVRVFKFNQSESQFSSTFAVTKIDTYNPKILTLRIIHCGIRWQKISSDKNVSKRRCHFCDIIHFSANLLLTTQNMKKHRNLLEKQNFLYKDNQEGKRKLSSYSLQLNTGRRFVVLCVHTNSIIQYLVYSTHHNYFKLPYIIF